jgi:hypothetical protein
MKILVYTDEKYEYQAKALIESIQINYKGEIPVIYYSIGFDSSIEYANLTKKRWGINKKHQRFPFYKPEICLDALLNFGGDILFLDSDILISRRFNPDFFKHDYDYPLLSVGNWDLPFYYDVIDSELPFPKFNINDRVLIREKRRAYLIDLFPRDVDCLGNIKGISKEDNSYMVLFDGKEDEIKINDSDLEDLRISDYSKLMKYYNIKSPTTNYVYSCCISFNEGCEDFIREWKSITENEYLNSFGREYYPIAEETSMNVTLWKNKVDKNYGRIFVNTLFHDVVKHVEETKGIINTNIFGNNLQKCEDSERVQFYHGMIDSDEIDKTINYFKMNMNNRENFPHLLNNMGLNGSGVELGTFKGQFSKIILDNWGGSLFMVDVWRPLSQEEYDDQSNHANHSDAYSVAMENTREHAERAHMLRCKGEIAANLFTDESLDFAYIDANHTYEAVLDDIALWYPKVKSGGILAGHDYVKLKYDESVKNIPLMLWNDETPDESYYAGMFGVNPAVDEFVKKEGYELNVTDEFLGTWWIIKK